MFSEKQNDNWCAIYMQFISSCGTKLKYDHPPSDYDDCREFCNQYIECKDGYKCIYPKDGVLGKCCKKGRGTFRLFT